MFAFEKMCSVYLNRHEDLLSKQILILSSHNSANELRVACLSDLHEMKLIVRFI